MQTDKDKLQLHYLNIAQLQEIQRKFINPAIQLNKIDNYIMDNVVVVAKLLKWNEIDNLLQLTLDDTTGVLTTKNYQYNADWYEQYKDDYKNMNYVRCILQPKQWKNSIEYRCLYLEGIVDENQMITHILDIIESHKFRVNNQEQVKGFVQSQSQTQKKESQSECRINEEQ